MTAVEADGVFEGGGIKTLAIAGALLEFGANERVVVERWENVAGTSAGAIIAAYLAAGRPSSALADLLHDAPFPSFQDFGPGGRYIGGAVNLIRHRGLARGEVFRRWFDDQLDGMTFGPLRAQALGGHEPEHRYRLRMVAADVTNHRLLVLPDDLPRYRRPRERTPIDPDTFSVADAVRMSASIPYYFAPVELVDARTGRLSTIVDGGTLSNFPVWLFDTNRLDPRRPTFGVRLVGGRVFGSRLRAVVRKLGWPAALALDIFQTQTDAWDERLLTEATRVRTCLVPAGDTAATDFGMPAAERARLIEGGRRAAADFLASFDLDAYRNSFGRRLGST